MINAKELRIGNWIYIGTDIICVDATRIADVSIYKNIYDPIPLTPEIIEKCGFKEKKEKFAESGYLYYERDVLQIKQVNDGFIRIDFTQFEIVEYIVVYKYLHQIQNLFFSLAGEELQIDIQTL